MDRRSAMVGSGALMLGMARGLVATPAEDAGNSKLFRSGPSGGTAGSRFSDEPTPKNLRFSILKGNVSVGVIFAIGPALSDGGTSRVFGRRGGETGDPQTIDFTSCEFIKAMDGTCDRNVVSLNFKTNQRTIRCGARNGAAFRYVAPRVYEIIGFNGKADTASNAIGVDTRKPSQ